MAGKRMPALFELIRDPGVNRAQKFPVAQQARKVGDPAPEPQPIRQPKIDIPVRQPVQVEKPKINLIAPTGPAPSASAPAAASGAGEKRFTITQSALWMVLAGTIVFGVIIWWVAYGMGYSKADKQALKDFGVSGAGGVKDPLKGSDIPVNPKLLPQNPAPGAPKAQPPKTPPRANPPQAAPQNTAGKPADTRQVGLNYCLAASRLDQAAAERAAEFLTQNGVPAIAVVDTDASGAKNPGSYKVFALQGITAEEFRNQAPVRTKVQSELTRLGQIYKKDPKGRVDFGQYTWEKLKP
jgi:hypothetical protein